MGLTHFSAAEKPLIRNSWIAFEPGLGPALAVGEESALIVDNCTSQECSVYLLFQSVAASKDKFVAWHSAG